MPQVSRITIYPIKSLPGCDLAEVAVLPSGALAGDRRWALVDLNGQFVNGKRCPAVHTIRAEYDLPAGVVELTGPIAADQFSLREDREAIAQWCTRALGLPCRLEESPERGFPDDTAAGGPTLVSVGTLREVASWFEGMTADEARRRFRVNLELDAAEAFWEDQVAREGRWPRFRIGETGWAGRTICQRCVVPSRDCASGAILRDFARRFAERREQTLPASSPRTAFDHFYRLSINLAPLQNGVFGPLSAGVKRERKLRCGDELVPLTQPTDSRSDRVV
jgi:uncharacterized protein YcbX